jgi:hypothetical protein
MFTSGRMLERPKRRHFVSFFLRRKTPFRAVSALRFSFRRCDIRDGRPLFRRAQTFMAHAYRWALGVFGRCSLHSSDPFVRHRTRRLRSSNNPVVFRVRRRGPPEPARSARDGGAGALHLHRSWGLALRVQARGIPSGTARAGMALRAKAALARSSPTKPVYRALSSSAKMALNHDRKGATLCHFRVLSGHALHRAIPKEQALQSRATESRGKWIFISGRAQSAKTRQTKPIATGS